MEELLKLAQEVEGMREKVNAARNKCVAKANDTHGNYLEGALWIALCDLSSALTDVRYLVRALDKHVKNFEIKEAQNA